MKISDLRDLLNQLATTQAEGTEAQSALTAIASALEPHVDADVQALVSKLSAVTIKSKAPAQPRRRTKTEPSARKPRPSKEAIAAATKSAIEALRTSYMDDEGFRAAMEAVSTNSQLTPAAARAIFNEFFNADLLPGRATKKSIFKQLREERQTDVLQRRRLGRPDF